MLRIGEEYKVFILFSEIIILSLTIIPKLLFSKNGNHASPTWNSIFDCASRTSTTGSCATYLCRSYSSRNFVRIRETGILSPYMVCISGDLNDAKIEKEKSAIFELYTQYQ